MKENNIIKKILWNTLYKNNGNLFFSCKEYIASENSSLKLNRLMLLSNCAVCGKKKSIFIKNK